MVQSVLWMRVQMVLRCVDEGQHGMQVFVCMRHICFTQVTVLMMVTHHRGVLMKVHRYTGIIVSMGVHAVHISNSTITVK